MNQFIRSITVLVLSAGLMHGAFAQAITGKGFLPDESGTNLDDPQAGKAAQRQKVAPGTIIKDCPECPEMVVIPAGSFIMGSSEQEGKSAGMNSLQALRESLQHYVRVTNFAAGRYAVTKGEFAAFVLFSGYRNEQSEGCDLRKGDRLKKDPAYSWRNVGFAQGDDHPVVCVTWNDAQAYIRWLNRISGKNYRLFSEAEREYAARGGTQTAFWWGDTINPSQANYYGKVSYNGGPTGQYRKATVPVNSFSANPFGLYNVHGNVWEWTQDCWHETYADAPTDGSAWTTGCNENTWVLRGGAWNVSPADLRSAFRFGSILSNRSHLLGFRLARDL